MQDDAGDGQGVVDLRVEGQEGLGALGHAERVLEQAVAVGVVHAEGGHRFVETLAVFLERREHRVAQAGVRDAGHDRQQLRLHLGRIVLRHRRQASHQRGIAAFGLGERREGVDAQVGPAVEVADRAADADDRAGLEGDQHGLDRRIAEDADLDVVGRVGDDRLVIGGSGLRELGGDVAEGADGLEAGADRGGLAFAECQEGIGHRCH